MSGDKQHSQTNINDSWEKHELVKDSRLWVVAENQTPLMFHLLLSISTVSCVDGR